ncbi:TIGR02569 family protein [Streptosporangium sp. NPDC004379]|uniref:TIGR02569 family protein n=1 Tax=Streptosporangium sp. NPDC004379 TaxID=3366189 RepID=UPI0036B36440
MAPSVSRPPEAVLAAFGIRADPAVLPGGKGNSWRADQVVLKPVEFLAETLWRSEVLTALPGSADFRVARPVRALDGAWVVDGWEASRLIEGVPDVGRQDDVLRAGIAFHTAIASLPRPGFLDFRDDPWSIGDRVAWEELPIRACPPALSLLEPLVGARRPVDLVSQAVHGDLPGNVLFADGRPPAIIDWSVYWRPASWAAAVAVADALCWYGASPALAARWSHLPAWGQMLVRALIYRIVTHETAFGSRGWTPDQVAAHLPTIDLAVTYAGHGAGQAHPRSP